MISPTHLLNPSVPSSIPGAGVPATAGTQHAELLVQVYVCQTRLTAVTPPTFRCRTVRHYVYSLWSARRLPSRSAWPSPRTSSRLDRHATSPMATRKMSLYSPGSTTNRSRTTSSDRYSTSIIIIGEYGHCFQDGNERCCRVGRAAQQNEPPVYNILHKPVEWNGTVHSF